MDEKNESAIPIAGLRRPSIHKMLYFVLPPFWAEKIRHAARSRNQLARSRERDPVKTATVAPPLPEQAGLLLHVRGADQLLRGYAAVPSNGLARAILNTVLALQPKDLAR
jgi:hypothetical protein